MVLSNSLAEPFYACALMDIHVHAFITFDSRSVVCYRQITLLADIEVEVATSILYIRGYFLAGGERFPLILGDSSIAQGTGVLILDPALNAVRVELVSATNDRCHFVGLNLFDTDCAVQDRVSLD